MGTESDNAEIMRQLGVIIGQIEGIRRELDTAKAERAGLREDVKAHTVELNRVDFAIENNVAVLAQTREALKELADVQGVIARNVQPLLDLRADLPIVVSNWKDLKRSGRFVGWALTISGGSFVAGLLLFGELVRKAVLRWLGL